MVVTLERTHEHGASESDAGRGLRTSALLGEERCSRPGSGRGGRPRGWRRRSRSPVQHLHRSHTARRACAVPLLRVSPCRCAGPLIRAASARMCAGASFGRAQQMLCIGLVCMVMWQIVVFFASHSGMPGGSMGLDYGGDGDALRYEVPNS